MGSKINFGKFLHERPSRESKTIYDGSGPLQALNTLNIRRSDVLSRSELNSIRGEVRRAIREGTNPVYGAIKVVSWIDENLRCLERQGIRLIQGGATGSYRLIDTVEQKKTILQVRHENVVNERKRNRMGNNREPSEMGFTSSRVRYVWNGNYIEVGRKRSKISELLDYVQSQPEITVDAEDEKEDVISIYASDPEFDDLEGDKRDENNVSELEDDSRSRIGVLDSEFNSLMVGSRLTGRIGVSSCT
ncbi:9085_t:CDS:1 [Acaulospora morrowiae]|uniref:9085_t:CDS:1 n=1 Tax=Acaulospora morrowiae TaxID=94023 RepID=A0A9N9D0D6_9GLOM|nr:9085_t:CDS:1 [Acaulospora morrowiae]